MNGTLSLNRRKHSSLRRLIILGMLVSTVLLLTSNQLGAAPVTTPLQTSGLTPLWQEDFTNGSIDRMQFSWFTGNNSALDAFVQPGAIYLGRDGGLDTDVVEQQINNFKVGSSEALPQTIEFDIHSPMVGRGRVSLRPSRWGDMVSILTGLHTSGRTQVSVGKDNQYMGPPGAGKWDETTGPTYDGGWAHVVISYQQYTGECDLDLDPDVCALFVVGINSEVWDLVRPSELVNYDNWSNWANEWASSPSADGWSFEHNSDVITFGRYIANVRFYSQALTKTDLQARLPAGGASGVDAYLASLANPTTFSGQKKVFQDAITGPLLQEGPNAILYAVKQGGADSKTFNFDGSLSSDLQEITSYQWNFGDGSSGSGRFVSRTYAAGGTYNVVLTVTSEARQDTYTIPVTVNGGGVIGPYKLFLPLLSDGG